jgi:hypothetical protein
VTKWTILILISVGGLLCLARSITSAYPSHSNTLVLIAREIEGLKGKYPQLKEFSHQGNLDINALKIVYAYRAHKAKLSGGWTAGVPSPDEHGIWFYIDFHDSSSISEINTQPASIARQCLGDKMVGFLILEGQKTTSVNGAIWQILRKYDVTECRK